MNRRHVFRTGLVLPLALALATLPACAHRPQASGTLWQVGSPLLVSVVDRDSGQVLPIYRHRGELWVAGTPGARYAVRLANQAGERVLAVVSIDGVNVVSGETASVAQTGYVLRPGQRSDIAGWRKSDSQIAAFQFTSLGDSYASRTGRPDNVGVIGVAVFRERPPAPPPVAIAPSAPRDEAERATGSAAQNKAAATGSSMADEARPMARARPAPSLGTGHGGRENSYVGHTDFERAQAAPNDVVRIRYDSRENLLAAGIISAPVYVPTPPRPTPFPAAGGYVPDPPRH